MTNRPERPRDPAQLAKLIVDIATGEVEDQQAKPHQQRKRGARSTQTGGRMAMRSWRVLLRGFFAWFFVAAIVLSASTSSWADGQPKRVLMLHSFGLRFKPWTDYAEQIRTEIGRRKSVDFHDHSLLGARVDDPKSEGPFVSYLSALNADQPPDLIVAIGAPAGSFVLRHRNDLFPNVPMVLTAVEQRRVDHSKLTENDTVVATYNDVLALFQHMVDVLPRTKTIAIVNGASANERPWKAFVQKEVVPLTGRVQFKWYDQLSFEEILKDAANLPANTAIFWLLMNVDAAGVAHEGRTALMRLAAVANAPIFTHDEAYFGDGILGGRMQSVAGLSKLAAEVAVRVLDGEKAGSIKTPPVPLPAPKYDWQRMQQFALSERDLPPGSEVFFKVPSPWETYRWQILTVSIALLLQGGLDAPSAGAASPSFGGDRVAATDGGATVLEHTRKPRPQRDRLMSSSGPRIAKPVALPRDRERGRSRSSASAPYITTGMVSDAVMLAAIASPPTARIASGFERTSSAAIAAMRA